MGHDPLCVLASVSTATPLSILHSKSWCATSVWGTTIWPIPSHSLVSLSEICLYDKGKEKHLRHNVNSGFLRYSKHTSSEGLIWFVLKPTKASSGQDHLVVKLANTVPKAGHAKGSALLLFLDHIHKEWTVCSIVNFSPLLHSKIGY